MQGLEDFRTWQILLQDERTQHSKRWKTLRERFRPWLAANQLSAERRNALRETLTRLESGRTSFAQGYFDELALEALDVELTWNSLRKPQADPEEEAQVTRADLERLRALFRKG